MSTVRPEIFEGYSVDLTDAQNSYLPDESIPPEERALDCLFRVSAEAPSMPVALQMIGMEDGTKRLAASFVWDDFTRIDILHNVAFEFEGVVWVTARSAAEALSKLLRGNMTDLSSVTMEQADPPVWADDSAPLIAREAVDDAVRVQKGLIQKFSSALADHHVVTVNTLTDQEREVLLRTALVQIGPHRTHIGSLITIGVLNPFASSEELMVAPTEKGTIIVGSQTVVGPL